MKIDTLGLIVMGNDCSLMYTMGHTGVIPEAARVFIMSGTLKKFKPVYGK